METSAGGEVDLSGVEGLGEVVHEVGQWGRAGIDLYRRLVLLVMEGAKERA